MSTERIQHKTRQLTLDTLLFGISTFGSKILIFLLTPLYTAVLMTEEYGVADLINTTVNMVYPVLTLAIADAVLRYTFDKELSKQAVLGNSLLLVFASTLLLAAVYPLMQLLNVEVARQLTSYWWYFVAVYFLFNLHSCLANFLKAIGKTKLFAVQGIVQTVAIIACNILYLLVFRAGLQGYLMSIIWGHIVPILLVLIVGKLYRCVIPFKVDRVLLKQMLAYSIPMIPTILAWAINTYIDKYMIISMLEDGMSASGIYSVAHKIPSILTAILSVFTQAWQLSAISNVEDEDESEFYTKIYGRLNIIAIIGCLGIVVLSKPVSVLLFDEDYYCAWQYIPFLTIAAFFSGMCGFLAAAFRAYKKTKSLMASVLIGAVVNVILNTLLIPAMGVMGAAVATVSGFVVTWIVRIITVQKLVKIKLPMLITVVTYALLAWGCVLISYDVTNGYWYYAGICVGILLLNLQTLKEMLMSFKDGVARLLGKKKK